LTDLEKFLEAFEFSSFFIIPAKAGIYEHLMSLSIVRHKLHLIIVCKSQGAF
jgi:hypothetical protein